MLVEEFSSGYYLTQAYVEPGSPRPQINDESYRDLQHELFPPGKHEDAILFQLDNKIFNIEPSRKVPSGVFEVPETELEGTRIRNPPSQREIMVPKPWMIEFLDRSTITSNEVL